MLLPQQLLQRLLLRRQHGDGGGGYHHPKCRLPSLSRKGRHAGRLAVAVVLQPSRALQSFPSVLNWFRSVEEVEYWGGRGQG